MVIVGKKIDIALKLFCDDGANNSHHISWCIQDYISQGSEISTKTLWEHYGYDILW